MKRYQLIDSHQNRALLCLYLLLATISPCFGVMNRPTIRVTTKLGTVIGTEENVGPDDGYVTENGARRMYHGYRGIPYAKPPVGDLRWKVRYLISISFRRHVSLNLSNRNIAMNDSKDPVPYGFWPNDLDGTNFGNQCPQFDRVTGRVVGDENCLFLNVFTPFTSVFRKLEFVLIYLQTKVNVFNCPTL